MDEVFRKQWEKERQEYVKKLGSKEYGCNVDYTCNKIDSIKDTIKQQIKDEIISENVLKKLEEIRSSIISLRDWGHDLRYLLLKEKENK